MVENFLKAIINSHPSFHKFFGTYDTIKGLSLALSKTRIRVNFMSEYFLTIKSITEVLFMQWAWL